ncbi:putative short chain dehydrogenase/ reductase, partial [Paraphoma chrysanthemicola]
LQDKVALVTGASSGIGRACAQSIAKEGAIVLCTDLHPEPNPRGFEDDIQYNTVEAIQKAGGRAAFRKMDIANRQEVEEVFRHIVTTYDRLDVVVSAAGLYLPLRKFADEDEELWERMVQVNLLGTARVNRLAIKQFLKQGIDPIWGSRGRIVNISSGAGKFVVPLQCAYGATKAGVDQMTRTASTDHANDAININGVAPGLVATGMARDNFENPEILAILRKATPLPRLGETKDIANAAHFLVSPASSWITGHILPVDGG